MYSTRSCSARTRGHANGATPGAVRGRSIAIWCSVPHSASLFSAPMNVGTFPRYSARLLASTSARRARLSGTIPSSSFHTSGRSAAGTPRHASCRSASMLTSGSASTRSNRATRAAHAASASVPHSAGAGDAAASAAAAAAAAAAPSDAAHTLLVNVGCAPPFAPAVLTGVCDSVLASVDRMLLLLELLELLVLPALLLALCAPGGEADAAEADAAEEPGAAWRRACGVMLPGTAVAFDVRQNDI